MCPAPADGSLSDKTKRHLMFSRFDAAGDGAFRAPITRRLLDYWRSKADAAGRRPAWTDLNLVDVYDIAPWIMVRDVVDGGREYRCRFCGTGLVEILDMDPTGKLLADVYAPEGQEMMRLRYEKVIAADAPVRVVGYIRVVKKNLPTGFEGVMLPLSGPAGTIDHIILALDFSYTPAIEEVPEPG